MNKVETELHVASAAGEDNIFPVNKTWKRNSLFKINPVRILKFSNYKLIY